MKTEEIKSRQFYMELPYTIVLKRDEDGDVVARVEELEGCMAHGRNEAEAIKNLRVIQSAWIEECLESGQTIPEPKREEDLPSGKWVQRTPRSLHQKLTRIAKQENVSLNQLVTSMLSEACAARVINRSVTELIGPSLCHQIAEFSPLHKEYFWGGAANWSTSYQPAQIGDIVPKTNTIMGLMCTTESKALYGYDEEENESTRSWFWAHR